MEKKKEKGVAKTTRKTKAKTTAKTSHKKAASPATKKSKPKAAPTKIKRKAAPKKRTTKLKRPHRPKAIAKTKKATRKKTTAKIKTAAITHFTAEQKAEFLTHIEEILHLMFHEYHSLKSLTGIADILDGHNQRYATIDDKFDAVVKYGVEKDPRVIQEYFYIVTNGRDKQTDDLYQLLGDIWNDNIPYTKAKEKIKHIYTTSGKTKT